MILSSSIIQAALIITGVWLAAGVCTISCCHGNAASVARWFSAASGDGGGGVTVGDSRPREATSDSATVGATAARTQVPASGTGRTDADRESRTAGRESRTAGGRRPVYLCTAALSDDEERAETHESVSEGQGL